MLLFYTALIDTNESKGKFELLYDLYKKRMWYTANQILHDPYQAEDAVHNAFIGIARNISHIDEVDSKATLAYVIVAAKHAALNLAKKNHNNIIEMDSCTICSAENQHDEIAATENKLLVISILKKIPDIYRDLLYLYYYCEMSEKEIALLTGRQYATVRKQMSRAKKVFLQMLEKEGDYCEKR